jgi:hypothetical protein
LKREAKIKVMKELGILFGDEWVLAILRGEKTQTRRPITPLPPPWITSFSFSIFTPDGYISGRGRHPVDGPAERFWKLRRPVGRRLWVKEAWAPIPDSKPSGYWSDPKWIDRVAWYRADNDKPIWGGDKWKPSILMPRWASRIDLKVVSVRAERVQSITHEDALAEGCSGTEEYASGWDRTYDETGLRWKDNPWVLVIEFKVVSTSRAGYVNFRSSVLI